MEREGRRPEGPQYTPSHPSFDPGDEVDDADLHRICVAMDEAAATVPAFQVVFGGVGVFADLRRPRVVCLNESRLAPTGAEHAPLHVSWPA